MSRRLYRRFHRFVAREVRAHRGDDARSDSIADDAALVAWAVVGLGTVANIGRELDLVSAKARRRLIAKVGRALLEARPGDVD